MNTCGTCTHYIEGKKILGALWRGSVCLSPERKPHSTLRMWKDKPLTCTCWMLASPLKIFNTSTRGEPGRERLSRLFEVYARRHPTTQYILGAFNGKITSVRQMLL